MILSPDIQDHRIQFCSCCHLSLRWKMAMWKEWVGVHAAAYILCRCIHTMQLHIVTMLIKELWVHWRLWWTLIPGLQCEYEGLSWSRYEGGGASKRSLEAPQQRRGGGTRESSDKFWQERESISTDGEVAPGVWVRAASRDCVVETERAVEGVLCLAAGLEVQEDQGRVDGDGERHEGVWCILELIQAIFQITVGCSWESNNLVRAGLTIVVRDGKLVDGFWLDVQQGEFGIAEEVLWRLGLELVQFWTRVALQRGTEPGDRPQTSRNCVILWSRFYLFLFFTSVIIIINSNHPVSCIPQMTWTERLRDAEQFGPCKARWVSRRMRTSLVSPRNTMLHFSCRCWGACALIFYKACDEQFINSLLQKIYWVQTIKQN